ncbi:hypothetical protein EVAR_30303_1 [Eumeta japonica]|uniref:Uncharacterized protein n=1 Tax=Eumeta variegata TaxID=151549 RepID=A0A4C1WAP8_EUMVA|nr:hypothetical protein EVAR_30303_1 [Eumeta japonica]
MIRCWSVNKATVFVTLTATRHLSSQYGSRLRILYSFATAKSAGRDDVEQLPCGTPARMGPMDTTCNRYTDSRSYRIDRYGSRPLIDAPAKTQFRMQLTCPSQLFCN